MTFFPFPFPSTLRLAWPFVGAGGPFARLPLVLDALFCADEDLLGARGGALCAPGLLIAEGGEPMILETAHGISYPAKPAFRT